MGQEEAEQKAHWKGIIDPIASSSSTVLKFMVLLNLFGFNHCLVSEVTLNKTEDQKVH